MSTEIQTIKASQLEELTEVTDSNYVVVTDGATSKKVKATNLKGDLSNINSAVNLNSEKINELNSQLEHKANKIVDISLFHDITNKWQLLKDLMTNYEIINIDENITIEVDEAYELNKSIKFIGNKKITVISSIKNVIKINNSNLSVEFYGVKFDLQNKGFFLSADGTEGYQSLDIENVIIKNCEITGKGVFCCFYIGTEDKNVVHVKNVEISNNYIYDLEMQYLELPNYPDNYQCYGLFIVENVSINSIKCEKNNITNSERTIFQLKDRNPNNYRNSITIRNNTLINDDSCFGDHTTYYIYYVFAIAESYRVEYSNNHVEGMKVKTKTPGGYGVVIYDCYARANYYIYSNNTFKNNVVLYKFDNLTPNNNFLIKSKDCENVEVTNSKFIIEKDYISKFTQDEEIIKNYFKLIDFDSNASIKFNRWLIDNCEFECPYISFESEGNHSETYKITNSSIKCETIFGAIFSLNSLDGKYREFSNNTIYAKNSHATDPLNLFISFYTKDTFIENSIMKFENNIFLVPNFTIYNDYESLTQSELRYQRYLRFEQLIIKNNIFNNNIMNMNNNYSTIIMENNTYLNNIVTSKYYYGAKIFSGKAIKIHDFIELNDATTIGYEINPIVSLTMSGYLKAIAHRKDGTTETCLFKVVLNPTTSTIDSTSFTTENCYQTVTKDNFRCVLYHKTQDQLILYCDIADLYRLEVEAFLK